jgi:hypothetical protein
LTTSNKNFRVKNGLEVLGVSATVNGNEVLTEASNLDALANVDTTGVVDGNTIVFNEATSTFIAGAISGGAAFEISDTAPENASHGDVWYNSNNGGLFIYFEDIDSEQWVQVGLAGPKGDTGDPGPTGETGEPGVAIQETEPEDTNVLWFDTSVDGAGIPLGGTAGQVLAKVDSGDFNTEWITPSGGGSSKEVRHEWDSPYDYIATATSGTLDSETTWSITRIEVFADGTTLTTTSTDSWNNRETAVYL